MIAPAYPSTKEEKAKTYFLVMEEVRSRLQAIDIALAAILSLRCPLVQPNRSDSLLFSDLGNLPAERQADT